MGSLEFSSEDIQDMEWTKINCKLGTLVALDEYIHARELVGMVKQ